MAFQSGHRWDHQPVMIPAANSRTRFPTLLADSGRTALLRTLVCLEQSSLSSLTRNFSRPRNALAAFACGTGLH